MMKHLLSIFLFLTVCFISNVTWSQQGKLHVEVSSDIYFEDSVCFLLTVSNIQDTVYAHIIDAKDDRYWDGITIESLDAGDYLVSMTNCGLPSDDLVESIAKRVEIREGQIARLYFDVSQYVFYNDLDEETLEEIVYMRDEIQFELSYFDFRWNPDGNNPKFNLGTGFSGYTWFSFSKHIGLLLGGGMGWNVAPLQIDQDVASNYPDEVKSTYYNYIYALYDMKLRFSSLNQQCARVKPQTVFFDLGVKYHLPLYFKRVTRFNIQDKLVNSFIHRYSDLRLYANIGVANFQFFASYRPFDFVGKDLPQFPRYNAGVKFNIHY